MEEGDKKTNRKESSGKPRPNPPPPRKRGRYCVIKENDEREFVLSLEEAYELLDNKKDKGIWDLDNEKYIIKVINIQEK